MIHSKKLETIILKRSNYSEADKIITVIAKDYGKEVLIAKGIRKLSSRKKGHLELFTHAKLQVINTKGMGIVTEAESINNFPELRKNLNRVRVAYLLTELIDKMTAEGQENQDIFQLLLDAFITLNSGSASKNFIVDFEKSLLELLGFGLPDPPHTRQRLETHIISITDRTLNSIKLK